MYEARAIPMNETWPLIRLLGAAIVLLLGYVEVANRNLPTTPLRSAWRWWRKNGVGPLQLVGRVVDFLRAFGVMLADVIPAAWKRGRDRWPEYRQRISQER